MDSPKQHHKSRFKKHRRTLSTGSDNIKLLSSGSSASDNSYKASFNSHSSTLPRHRQLTATLPRPGSADSMCFEMHSPVTIDTIPNP